MQKFDTVYQIKEPNTLGVKNEPERKVNQIEIFTQPRQPTVIDIRLFQSLAV